MSLALFLAILAPVVAWWFSEPELQPLLLALALVPIIQGILSVPQAEMQKRGAIPQIAMGETLGTFAGFGVAVWIATHGGGAWALVGQQLVFWIIRAFGVGCFTNLRPQSQFSWDALGEHLKFGRDTIGFALVNFILRQSHNLVIGKLLGSYPLGVYSVASRFSNLPADVIGGPILYSLYAHLARMKDDKAAMRHIILSVTRLLAILVLPPMALVAAGGETFFTLFLSDEWSDVSTIFLLIAPSGALQGIAMLYGTVLMATGETGKRLQIAVEMAIYWLALLFATISFGIKVVAVANTIWFLSYFPRLLRLFLSSVDCKRSTYIAILIRPAAIAIGAALIHYLVNFIFKPGPLQEMAVIILELILAWGICILIEKRQIKDDTQYLSKILQRT